MLRFILLCFFFVSCGSEQSCQSKVFRRSPPNNHCTVSALAGQVHTQLDYAINLFSADAIKHDVDCYFTSRIGFTSTLPKDVPVGTIGYCYPYSEVKFLTRFWQVASATERLTLFYHEMGHCALGLDHKDDEDDIMNSYILDEVVANEKWDILVNKLFERAKQ